MLQHWQISLISALWLGTVFPTPTPSVPPSPLEIAQNGGVKIDRMRLIEDETLTAGRYTVEGQLTNTGSDGMRSLRVIFRLYRQEGDRLVEVDSSEATVIPAELRPGGTGKFGRAFAEPPQVVFIEAIASPDGRTEVNECYADSLERRQLCRRQLDPVEVFPLGR